MTKYFTAIDKTTGKEIELKRGEYLVMSQSGQVWVCANSEFYGTIVTCLDTSKYVVKPKEIFIDRIDRMLLKFKHTFENQNAQE